MKALPWWTLSLIVLVGPCFTSRAVAQDDVAEVPSQRVELAEKRVYFLIGEGDVKADAAPRTLLLVLPGGAGGEEFNPFVRRIWKYTLPANWIVAQLVAVPSNDPNQIVWPTSQLRHAKQTFTTESFIADVVADVGKRVKIDSKRVYALGWSSSGPALYVTAASKDSPITDFFIAMSVFKLNQLPSPEAMKGKRFYLLHSPDDRTCPIAMAREASKKLPELGATAKLTEYAGGHGWHGNIFVMIREGIQWLGKQTN